MRKIFLATAIAAATVAVPAMAQDMSGTTGTTTTTTPATDPTVPATDPAATVPAAPATDTTVPAADTSMQTAATDTGPTAPDGTPAFGFKPYVGIMGGWEGFDNEPNKAGIPARRNKIEGALVQGVVGFNVPLGPVFVGAEGNVAKGWKGDIDWQYGAAGRFGFRAGDSGLIYGKVGYQWVNFDRRNIDPNRDFNDITYGIGYEVGPKSIGLQGITGNAGFRIRGEVSTFGNAHSLRPMLGVITHF